MNVAEVLNWSLFSLLGLAAATTVLAYFKSYSIIRPAHRRTPVAIHPDQFKLAYETIDFPTADGLTLRGWFIPAAGGATGKTIILCHGMGVNRGDLPGELDLEVG